MYPVCSFEHYPHEIVFGEQYPEGHPMVLARPDLFTPNKPKKEATPK